MNPVVDPVPPTNHRVIPTALSNHNAPAEHRMMNPVVDPVPPTNHRVTITALLRDLPVAQCGSVELESRCNWMTRDRLPRCDRLAMLALAMPGEYSGRLVGPIIFILRINICFYRCNSIYSLLRCRPVLVYFWGFRCWQHKRWSPALEGESSHESLIISQQEKKAEFWNNWLQPHGRQRLVRSCGAW